MYKRRIKNDKILTDSLEIRMRFADQIMANRKDLNLVAIAWPQIVQHQSSFVDAHILNLTSPVVLMPNLVVVLP